MREEIRETRLANGLTILTDRMHGVRSATLGFFFRVGARHEPEHLSGISHFIEHAVFKGTSKRSALDIAIEQDRLGGNLDAFTTHEETGFAVKVIDDQLPIAFELISDMLVRPSFAEADLKSEQKVIIEEMKMVEDSPEEYLGEIFNEAFFEGHPLGRNIAGTPSLVRSFDRNATAEYHAGNYHAANLVITAAGNVEHDRIVELAASNFGETSNGGYARVSATTVPSISAPIIVKQRNDLEQAHLIIATPFVAATDDRRYAADLLAGIIGGGTSSRLWQTVREERGLAYSVGASAAMYQDCGLFSVFAGTSPDQVGEVVDLAVAEMRNVAADGVTPEELQLAKQQTVASILLGLEDSAARAATLAQAEMIHGRQISLEESLANLEAVTTENIKDLAVEFFRTENVAFAALGDLDPAEIDRGRLAI